ncbi:MerR family transcriptional regulator [Neobacillus sp. DY30]|uniref:MerR family transcriptional regulator n=1 Tax=Neobacillus sp. DY30 TaxID=3047871 RepID=UPI0024C0473C|nr:MerR family transcriptional regulator [Neobacillus sp. DY30]WHY03456.1 MerR family transcriptional regulator [Neobacillus sp. DY30]
MGELAEIAMVSKRTIDYYTSIGLLSAERSKSNYRIYSDESLKDLKFIEECKSLHYPLEEIKRKLDMKKDKTIRDSEVEKHVNTVTQQMQQLQNDLFDLIPFIEKLDDLQKEKLTSNLMMLKSLLTNSLLNETS